MSSKKDYKAIAQIIKDWTIFHRDSNLDIPILVKEFFVDSLSEYFSSDSPNFDPEKFRQACE